MIFVALGFDVHDPYDQTMPVVHSAICPGCGIEFRWHCSSSYEAGFLIH